MTTTTQDVAVAVTRDGDVPVRATGLELIGEMAGSGYRHAPSLVRRADGQTFQLTRLLFLTLEAIDGTRNLDEVAAAVSTATGRHVRGSDVARLVDTKLRPLGLLTRADGSEPELKRANPLLALRFRWVLTNRRVTNAITRPFAFLFHPVIVVPVAVAFVAVCAWVLFDQGLAAATYQAFDRPELLLAVFGLTVLSAGFHEFGHAAAARYGGATPGAMGVGLYLVWPAFYTDVSDSYRLDRRGRIRTDLGGVYFNAIFTLAAFGAWWISGAEALLLIIPAQILQMIQQLTPLLRFDGYHILADLTGVPDLYQRIKPTLLGLLPHRWRHPESRVLKPWARAVVSVWVLVVVPLLVASIVVMVLALPRVMGTAWRGLEQQTSALADAWNDVDVAAVAARCLLIVFLVIPVFGMLYIVVRLVRRVSEMLWRANPERPKRRLAAQATAIALLGGLSYAWWPTGENYRPVQAYERLTLGDAVDSLTGSTSRFGPGYEGATETVWVGSELPTRERPTLAVVMRPKDGRGQTWVFPFNRPLPPGEGDNQALAVNTTDGTVVYEVAFALVWVRDGEVTNRNEAYAFASCEGCAAVAVGFQVVLIVGEVDVVVPENLAGAVNYACVSCVTYALATQLVVTLPGELSEAANAELAALWEEIRVFGENVEGVPLSELESHLEGFKTRIVDVITRDLGIATDAAATPTTVTATTVASATTVSATTVAAETTEPAPPSTTESESTAASTSAPSTATTAPPTSEPAPLGPSPSSSPTTSTATTVAARPATATTSAPASTTATTSAPTTPASTNPESTQSTEQPTTSPATTSETTSTTDTSTTTTTDPGTTSSTAHDATSTP